MILEAREKLKGHLPQFWLSMFKLTSELRKLASSNPPHTALAAEAKDLVDSLVRPALLDLKHKLESERKQWFYRILSLVQKGLRLIATNPPLTQQQLITDALVIASDVTTNVAHHLRSIEELTRSAGLTYLLELDKMSSTESGGGSKDS